MKFRTPLKTAKGLGSAKSGTHHWIQQRISAIALILLVLWFMSMLINMLSFSDYEQAVATLSSPFNATMLVLFLVMGFYHGTLGLQVIIEDYVHQDKTRMLVLIGMKLFMTFCAVGAVISALKIAFS